MTKSAQGISDSTYARSTRELIKLVTELRGLGAQADVDLPRIAVIGNQSAGKSSLVEAISGITVPRAKGTCTRCPMECRLTQSTASSKWQSQVKLRIEFDSLTHSRLQRVTEENFGDVVTDPALLEDVLRCAQLAILNPSVPARSFVNFDVANLSDGNPPLGSKKQLQFSKNVVCLDLQGPQVTDLSFIDLPGIISNVGPGEDRNNITLIKDLVMSHIKGNCLILLTLNMRDDIENQSAAFFAREVDPDGRRTIGVLTKPDALQRGEEPAWVEVIRGQRHVLTHGYFITKQPDIQELTEKLSWERARKRERAYFEKNEIWAKAGAADRLGTTNLTNKLSSLLSILIKATLPRLMTETTASLAVTQKELSLLPTPVSNQPVSELLNMVAAFANDLKQTVRGDIAHSDLIQACFPLYKDFRSKIKSTSPNFVPQLSFEDSAPKEINRLTVATTITKISGSDGSEASIDILPHAIYLDDVRQCIVRSRTRELPYNVPYSSKAQLIRDSTARWHSLSILCFNTIHHIVKTHVESMIESHFGRFEKSGLLGAVRVIAGGLVQQLAHSTMERLRWLISLEESPFTLNEHYFTSNRETYLASYRESRARPVLQPQAVQHTYVHREGISQRGTSTLSAEEAALSALASLGYQIKAEDLKKLLPSDEYEEELIVMAEVRAYWQVSFKRIIDDVPRVIDKDFMWTLANSIQEELLKKLGVGEGNVVERAKNYLEEDPDVVGRRTILMTTRKRLEDVCEKLSTFGMTASFGSA